MKKRFAKNIKLSYFFLFLLIYFLLYGSNSNPKLDKISHYYLQKIPFQLKFAIQSLDNEGNTLSKMRGTFILTGKDKFKVKYPQEQILYDGQWLWTYNETTNQVVVEEFEPTSSLNLIYDVINGDLNDYEIVKSESSDNGSEIFLKPKEDNNFFKNIKLTTTRDTCSIRGVKYVDFQKNQIRIDFLQISDTLPPDSTFYNIKQMKDKQLIDLRP